MSKQRIDYRPSIGYTSDYETAGKTISQQNIMFGPQKNQKPLDTQTIPEIENNIVYLDSVIRALPLDFQMALREVYDPIREIYYDTLIDKIVDPNPHKPGIIIEPKPKPDPDPDPDPNPDPNPDPDPDPNPDPDPDPNPDPDPDPDPDPTPDPDPDPDPPTPGDTKNVHPIILRPIGKNNPGGEDPDDDKTIHPIILKPIKDDDPGDDDPGDDITAPYPIILHPIPSGDPKDPDPGDPEYPDPDDPEDPEDPEEGDPGLWEPSPIDIKYLYPDINDAVDREFIYLLTKLLKHYTDRLKDILNNYYFNIIRYNLGQSKENIKFISNKLQLSSNDIMNHSKHLLDSSVKSENVAALRTEFFKNVFSIRDTAIHVRSFYVSHELRKRYTNIKYSKGKSIANSNSDAVLTKLNAQYELQYRKNFENLFRYLESSLKVTEDILRLHIQDGLNKSTIIKKGGIK